MFIDVQVCAVTSPHRPRYSIFGWFLSEKILYDLNVGGEGGYGSRQVAEGGRASSKGKRRLEGGVAGVEEQEAGGDAVNKKKRKGGDGEGSRGEGEGEGKKKKKRKKKEKEKEVKVEGNEGRGGRGRLKLSCVPRKKAIIPLSLVRPRWR
jgi:hypothetical protein